MTSQENKHQKHNKLRKPAKGDFGRNELALIGAPCGELRLMAERLGQDLQKQWNVAWVDAYHPEEESAREIHLYRGQDELTMVKVKESFSPYQLRKILEPYDLVLLNGNHFRGQRQVIILDARKEESLSRKTDRLTNPLCIVSTSDRKEPYDFLQKTLAGKEIPLFGEERAGELTGLVEEWLRSTLPKVNGLILVGGKSARMGRDKSRISYHGQEQFSWLHDRLENHVNEVFLSCRPQQSGYFESLGYATIEDAYQGLGPFGAILSAFQSDPDKAWLVLACDLPKLCDESIEQLLKGRNATKIATAFHNPATGFPDPLVTLWEPKAYPEMLWFLSQGHSCPRKVLINSEIEILQPINPDWLLNINTPEELDAIAMS